MYKAGSLIVYGTTGVCRVKEVSLLRLMQGKEQLCYTLQPLYSTETIYIPVDTAMFMRELMTKEQIDALIDAIPARQPAPLPCSPTAAKEYYDAALRRHDSGDLLELVRQIYLKARTARENRRSPSQTDQRYFKRAEDLLYGEFAAVLNIPREEVAAYIAGRLERDPVN